MKINLKIKSIVSIGVLLISSIFGIILYIGYSNFYMRNVIQKFVDENIYSTQVASNFLIKEEEILIGLGKQVIDSPKTIFAFKRNEYVSVNLSIENENPYKLVPINSFLYKKLAGDLKKELLGDNGGQEGKIRKDIVLYSKNGEVLADTGIKREDNSNDKYLKDVLNSGRLGFSTGLLKFSDDILTVKSISTIGWFGGEDILGAVEIKKNADGMMLEEIKNTTHKEILIIKDNKIVNSTLFVGDTRIKGTVLKEKIRDEQTLYLINFNKRKMGFNFAPITDYEKKVIGYIGTGFYYDEVETVFKNSKKKFVIYSLLFAGILVAFLFILFSIFTAPFSKIIEGLKKIAEGDYVEIQDSFGIKEIAMIAESTNKMSSAIKRREYELELARRTLSHMNEELDIEVMSKTQSIRNILNNAGQGFMTFGRNQKIDDEYSSECIKIFGDSIRRKLFIDIIQIKDEEDRAFIERIIGNILDENGEDQREVYISLLPQNMTINEKYIELDYKYIAEENKIMAIVTDNTESRQLALRMEKERNNLKMLVKAASYNTEVRMILKEFISFYKKKVFKMKSIDEINREIHTFKGNFGQFNFTNTANQLNLLEQKIFELGKSEMGQEEILKTIQGYNFEAISKEDIKIINRYFGEEYLTKEEMIEIKEDVLINLETRMNSILAPGELNMLMPDVLRMRYKSLKDLLKNYPEYTINLAQTLGKEIEWFKVEGIDVLVDSKKYRELSKSLVHIFRNIADHGIEIPEVRLRAGKKTSGKISINTNKIGDKILISVSDDGVGIDEEKIKEKLLELKIYSIEEIEKMSSEQIYESIFIDNFSTKSSANEISGRGVGLSALKKEVEYLDGEIKVITKKGKGTTFLISIPHDDAEKIINVSGDHLLNSFMFCFYEYFNLSTNVEIVSTTKPRIVEYEDLKKYSSTISIKGSLHGDVIFSVDESLARKLVECFIDKDDKTEFTSKNILETITEILNIIIGNSSQYLFDQHKIIMTYFDVSETREGDNMKIIKSRFDMWATDVTTNSGKMSLLFIEKGNKSDANHNQEGIEFKEEEFLIEVKPGNNEAELGHEIDLEEFDIETIE